MPPNPEERIPNEDNLTYEDVSALCNAPASASFDWSLAAAPDQDLLEAAQRARDSYNFSVRRTLPIEDPTPAEPEGDTPDSLNWWHYVNEIDPTPIARSESYRSVRATTANIPPPGPPLEEQVMPEEPIPDESAIGDTSTVITECWSEPIRSGRVLIGSSSPDAYDACLVVGPYTVSHRDMTKQLTIVSIDNMLTLEQLKVLISSLSEIAEAIERSEEYHKSLETGEDSDSLPECD